MCSLEKNELFNMPFHWISFHVGQQEYERTRPLGSWIMHDEIPPIDDGIPPTNRL